MIADTAHMTGQEMEISHLRDAFELRDDIISSSGQTHDRPLGSHRRNRV